MPVRLPPRPIWRIALPPAFPLGVWNLVITYDNDAEGGWRNLIVNAVRLSASEM